MGQAAARESLPEIEKALAGADMVFVTAGNIALVVLLSAVSCAGITFCFVFWMLPERLLREVGATWCYVVWCWLSSGRRRVLVAAESG